MNTSFCSGSKLQFAWDSTSLRALQKCPTYYHYTIVQGWQPRRRSVHLDFGIWYHSALERYDHARAKGASFDEALHVAVRYALEVTWNRELGRPWISEDPNKNRFTLLRSIVWFLEQWRSTPDPVETVILANGKPAVELSFRLALNKTAPSGEEYVYCGHLDKMATFQSQHYIVDKKTTKHTIDEHYFASFTPGVQFSGYTLAAKIVYAEPVKGLIVDAVQVAVGFSRFQRGLISKTESQHEEFYADARRWIDLAETFVYHDHWPMNTEACYRCEFRSICSKSPEVRQEWLEKDFVKRVWDPLIARGDI